MRNSAHGHLKQLMVDSLSDCALILLDTEGKVLSWNAGAKGLLGYDEAEAVGQPFSWIVPRETLEPAGAPPSLAIAQKNGRHEEICRRTHSNGADLDVREIVIPLLDPQHNLLAFGVMMQSLGASMSDGAAAAPSTATPKVTKVLAVDDDDAIRTIAEHLLKELGYEVLVAAGGPEALDMLTRDEGIDLLFTDVVMPGMDGGELAERARLIRPNLKVLFTSGYFEHALIKKGQIAQNADILVKPYQGHTLAKRIEMTLAKDSAAPVEPQKESEPKGSFGDVLLFGPPRS